MALIDVASIMINDLEKFCFFLSFSSNLLQRVIVCDCEILENCLKYIYDDNAPTKTFPYKE